MQATHTANFAQGHKYSVQVIATDAFGRDRTESQDMYIDTSAPVVSSISLSNTFNSAGKIWLKSRKPQSLVF